MVGKESCLSEILTKPSLAGIDISSKGSIRIQIFMSHLKVNINLFWDNKVSFSGDSDTIPNHHKTRLLHYNNFERFVLENIHIWRTVIEDWVRVGDILVVHYENILEDRTTELKKILNFLDVEVNETRIKCVEYCKNDMYKRKMTTTDQSSPPYTDFLRKEVDKSMQYIDDLLVEFEHESLPFVKYNCWIINACKNDRVSHVHT